MHGCLNTSTGDCGGYHLFTWGLVYTLGVCLNYAVQCNIVYCQLYYVYEIKLPKQIRDLYLFFFCISIGFILYFFNFSSLYGDLNNLLTLPLFLMH